VCLNPDEHPGNAGNDGLFPSLWSDYVKKSVDLVINARWIVPVEPDKVVLEHHGVAIDDGAIVAVLPQAALRADYAAGRVVALDDHVLIPGLVNLHTHAAMTLMRGIADDLPLMQWLQDAIWPAEAKHVSPAFVRDGTLLAAAEMLRGGVTTCNDMYFHPEAAAEAFDRAGMRAVLGIAVLDFPTPYAATADEYLRKGLAARDRWLDHARLRFAMAPHAPYTVSDASLERITTLAAELDLPIHIHVHETAQEIADSITQHGMRPLARLAQLGVLGSNLIGVHAVHLDGSDFALLERYNCSIAHCPTSNMKLASGIAPVTSLLQAGIAVGLGTDGAASNNRLDMFAEMRQAALLAKVATHDATALPAHTALRMVTLAPAHALGLGDAIGSIAVGKRADLCAVALDRIETRPCFDPVSHLVYAAGREHVSHVWVDGEARVDNGEYLLQNSNNELIGISALWQTRLQS
jgi:5-methylthioadenosine/S-adenosylhomocysteine deaminase